MSLLANANTFTRRRNSRRRNFNKTWVKEFIFSTFNIHSFGCKRADSEYNYSYCESLNHDASCITETWNTQRHFESWRCVVSKENLSGKDRPAEVCIILSKRFASLQMNRGNLGTRGCCVRIKVPVCNLLIIGIYLPSQYSRATAVELLKALKELLQNCSEHDCIILLGDFSIRGGFDMRPPGTHLYLKTPLFWDLFCQDPGFFFWVHLWTMKPM